MPLIHFVSGSEIQQFDEVSLYNDVMLPSATDRKTVDLALSPLPPSDAVKPLCNSTESALESIIKLETTQEPLEFSFTIPQINEQTSKSSCLGPTHNSTQVSLLLYVFQQDIQVHQFYSVFCECLQFFL